MKIDLQENSGKFVYTNRYIQLVFRDITDVIRKEELHVEQVIQGETEVPIKLFVRIEPCWDYELN